MGDDLNRSRKMSLFRIRTIALLIAIPAVYYLSQHYTLIGWQDLRLQKVTSSPQLDSSDSSSSNSPWLDEKIEAPRSNSSIPDVQRANQNPIANSFPTLGVVGQVPRSSLTSQKNALSTAHVNEPACIRIASFNLHSFNESKLQKRPVVETLARIIRQFDVIALQHIDARHSGLVPALVDRINMSDRRYDYALGPHVGPDGKKQQFAFLFDATRIETDRDQLYTLEDPQNLIDYEPIVGWFRVKNLQPTEAFTFSLVNVRIDPNSAERERGLLPAIVRSVRQDGRLEDDIIVLGDFSSSSQQLQEVAGLNMTMALEEVATTVSGEWMLDNILFPARSTDEFTGRSGVIDFLRQLNLSYDQSMQISMHLPVWAEFSPFEGGTRR